MFDPAVHLATIYATLGEPVTPAVGAAFNATVSFDADAAFDVGLASRVSLRYPVAGAPTLIEGDVVTWRGASWRLAEDPQPIGDGREMSGLLRRV